MIHYIVELILTGLIGWMWYKLSLVEGEVHSLIIYIKKRDDVSVSDMVEIIQEGVLDDAIKDLDRD